MVAFRRVVSDIVPRVVVLWGVEEGGRYLGSIGR